MAKENIKRFFKPDVGKIVLAFLMLWTVASITASIPGLPIPDTLYSLILKLSCPLCDIFKFCVELSGVDIGKMVGGIIFFTLLFVYYYFLSCLIIFLYHKIKSKKLK